VQLDPIKPRLKPPVASRLKLKYDELVSSYGFKLKLRRYMKKDGYGDLPAEELEAQIQVCVCICAAVIPVFTPPGIVM